MATPATSREGNMQSMSSSDSIRRNFSDQDGGRLNESTVGRGGGRRVTDEVIQLPEIGERTIYVTDEGLIDSGEFDEMSEEFRNRLGLVPEEQQELSEVFKVRIGMATTDRDQVERLINEIDSAMSTQGQRREDTIRRNNLDTYAARNFQSGSPPVQFTREPLRRPLLTKTTVAERRASLAVWMAILRFVDGVSGRKLSASSKVPPALEGPIITQVWELLETPHDERQQSLRRSAPSTPTDDTSRRLSLKKLFQPRSSKTSASRQQSRQDTAPQTVATTSLVEAGNDDTSLLSDQVIASIPTTEIDLINYIVAHGILSKQLRDEIYCQLCCIVSKNPSVESRHKGWMLHLFCAGCFLPSVEFLSYYYAFLYEVAADDDQRFANLTRRTLRRTNSNGMRFHPPNSVELAGTKSLRPMQLDVAVPDGRVICVNVDSASTSSEMCEMIASNINIKDSFGFSLHITVDQKISSLGSGLDHVMDAITECEQLVRTQGRIADSSSWRLFYRKELFTPWYNPSLDQVATDLIYRQIVDNVQTGNYRLHRDDIVTYVARCLYVENGRKVDLELVKAKMSEYFPASYMTSHAGSTRARDALARAVVSSFDKQGFSGYAVPARYIQHELVASASSIWPTHFSAMFEAYCIGGPELPRDDLILAVNSCGVFLLDSRYEVVVGFHFYDIIDLKADNSMGEIRQASIDLLAVDGAEFKLLCPNSETVARIVAAFLDGLRRRSRWAVALDQSLTQTRDRDLSSVAPRLYMRAGDLVELQNNDSTNGASTSASSSRGAESRDTSRGAGDVQLMYGRNVATGDRGSFPASSVYILPTIDRPSPDFISLLKDMTRETMGTLPRTVPESVRYDRR